jgi:hypothetical protein
MNLLVRYGSLLRVVGRPRSADGIWFAPGRVWIEDPMEYPQHSLQEYNPMRLEWAGDFDLGDTDAAWVRAALPGVFEYAPLHVADGRDFLLDAGFVAVFLDNSGCGLAYPFACTDAGQGTGLVFSNAGPDTGLRKRIAQAFWGLLQAEAKDHLSAFVAERVAFDTGDGYDTELEIGYARGQFYAVDLLDRIDE